MTTNTSLLRDMAEVSDPTVRLVLERDALVDQLAQPTDEERLAQLNERIEQAEMLRDIERRKNAALYGGADLEARNAQRDALKATQVFVDAVDRARKARAELERL